MKVKVLDLCVVNPKNRISEQDEEELFEIEEGSWSNYIEALNSGNLDNYNLEEDEVDKSVFIIDDGGELIRLKDGTYLNVCWRGDYCRVWQEDDDESISYYNKALK